MKPRKLLALAIVAAAFVCVPAMGLGAKILSVQVKQGALRSVPSFLGKIVARVSYGDRVEPLEKRGGWSKVKPVGKGPGGWIHDSALTEKKIELRAGKGNVPQSTTGDELALAGKGFNKQVEGKYRAENPEADFAAIDRMEKIVISEKQMQRFIRDGQLTLDGGAQ